MFFDFVTAFDMDLPHTVIVLISSSVVFLLTFIYWRIKKAYEYFRNLEIVGPSPTFPVGSWNNSARSFLGHEDVVNIDKYGPIVGTFDGLTPNLLIADPDIIKKIISTDAAKFKSRRAEATKNSTLKGVLRVLDNDNQKDVTSLLNTPLNNSKISKLVPRLETTANGLVRSLLKARTEGIVTANDVVADFVEDTTALALLGVDLNADPVFRQGFIRQCKSLLSVNNSSSALAVIPYLYGGADNWAISKNSLEYFKAIVSSGVKERSRDEQVESKAADLIDILLSIAAEEKKIATKEKAQEKSEESVEESIILKDEVITELILSSILVLNHWVRSTVLFSIFAMAQNPAVQQKLWVEVKKAQETEKLNSETIDKLTYLNAFIKEVGRLYPAEFRLEKVAEEKLELTETLKIEKGTVISIPVFAIHTSKNLHPDAETFSPERFLNGNYEKQSPFVQLPQGSSIATCLGILATKVAVAKIIAKVQVEKTEDSEAEVYQKGITGFPLPGTIRVKVEARD